MASWLDSWQFFKQPNSIENDRRLRVLHPPAKWGVGFKKQDLPASSKTNLRIFQMLGFYFSIQSAWCGLTYNGTMKKKTSEHCSCSVKITFIMTAIKSYFSLPCVTNMFIHDDPSSNNQRTRNLNKIKGMLAVWCTGIENIWKFLFCSCSLLEIPRVEVQVCWRGLAGGVFHPLHLVFGVPCLHYVLQSFSHRPVLIRKPWVKSSSKGQDCAL